MTMTPLVEDRVLPATKIVSAVIIPFLVAAFAVLYPNPDDTTRHFAWAIAPTMSSMVLGAVYLGGAYFFARVVRSTSWHTVAGGFLPVATFAGLMGVATILHWDRFIHANVAFWLWTALYFSTPFVVFAVFVLNHREYRPATQDDVMISRSAARIILVGGSAAVLVSAFLFLFPTHAVTIWPWKLTPLTARTLGAVFALGSAGLGVRHERRWSAARVLLQVEGFMLVLILIAGIRARTEFDTTNVLTWLFAAGFSATAGASVVFYLRMQARSRSAVADRTRAGRRRRG